MLEVLGQLYDSRGVAYIIDRLGPFVGIGPRRRLVETSVVLSMYADHLAGHSVDGRSMLRKSLDRVSEILPGELGLVNHILSPYVSDGTDRFSIVDDSRIDPLFGSWDDFIDDSTNSFMLDFVSNQVSVRSEVFREYLARNPAYADYFFRVLPSFDLSLCQTSRRRSPVATFTGQAGVEYLWSSHGGQQVDLNYRNPKVFVSAVERLRCIARAASWLRLDGIAFSWKESGTTCTNLPEARLLCDLLSQVWRELRPNDGVVVAEVDDYEGPLAYVTETAPSGPDLTYNYALPPALVAAITMADVGPLAREVRRLSTRRMVSWLNIAATHDGISLRPWLPVLPDGVTESVTRISRTGGIHVVEYVDESGVTRYYELDGLPADFEALSQPSFDRRPSVTNLVNSLLLSLRGIPLLYLPASLGSRSEGQLIGDDARNRIRFRIREDDISLGADGVDYQALPTLRTMLRIRSTLASLNASSPMALHYGDGGLLVFSRGADDQLLAVHNFAQVPRPWLLPYSGQDLLSSRKLSSGPLVVSPRTAMWIRRI